MNKPVVSIITPSLNQAAFLRSTIESVLAQDYPKIEYIIMDGGSTDATAAIAAEYGDRLTFISEKDYGQAHAINKGFRLAQGEIVAWLNSDDILLPGSVSKAVEALRSNATIGAVYGEGYILDETGGVKCRFPATEPFNLWKLIHVSDYILQQTVYFRRSALDEVGFLDERLHWALDWDLLIRMGKKFHLQYLPDFMGSIREHDQAKTLSGGHQRFRELVSVMRAHGRMRYPPAFFTYGLDTYFRFINRFLPFPSWRNISSRIVYGFVISKVLQWAAKHQGIYSDGWAGPYLRWMLPAGKGAIRISGSAPSNEHVKSQSIAIYCDGSLVAQSDLRGDFTIQFDYPGHITMEPVTVEVRAASAFSPTNDDHKLAYRLRVIEWSRA